MRLVGSRFLKVLKRHSAGFDGVFKVAVRNFGDVKVLLGGCSSFKEGWSREAARAKLDSLKEVSRLAPKCGDYVALERILYTFFLFERKGKECFFLGARVELSVNSRVKQQSVARKRETKATKIMGFFRKGLGR